MLIVCETWYRIISCFSTARSFRMENFVFPVVFLVIFSEFFSTTQAREFCQAEGYWCDTGHCCGSGECCTYYYELWWFWLVWFLIVFIIGFCVWQRKRFHPWRDNRCERSCSIQDMFRGFNFSDITPVPPCKLPTYAEIGETVSYDTPPPPYAVESAMPVCLGEGPSSSASLPIGRHHMCPPHRGLQAITRNSASLNSTPSPLDDPPSYSQIITSNTRIFAALPNTPILPHHMSTMATQYPEQGSTPSTPGSSRDIQQTPQNQQNQSQQNQQHHQQQNHQHQHQQIQQLNQLPNQSHQNQNNSGSNNRLNSPATLAVQAVPGVTTCSCGSPLRAQSQTPPQRRMLPPTVPSSPKPTVVAITQRPQSFLSPHGSPHHITTSVVSSPSSRNSSCSNLSVQGSPHVARSSASHSGTPATLPRPGSAVRTSPCCSGNNNTSPSNGQTVVDMRTERPRKGSFMSRFHLR